MDQDPKPEINLYKMSQKKMLGEDVCAAHIFMPRDFMRYKNCELC